MNDLAKLQTYLSAQDDVALAYLFGSQAADRAAIGSDHDIALLTQPAISPARRYQLASEICIALDGVAVDLVLLNRAPIELAYAVIAEGRCLFERSVAARVEFEADVLSRYSDYVYTLRQQRTDLLHGGVNEAGIRRNRAALGKTQRVLAEIGTDARQAARRIPG